MAFGDLKVQDLIYEDGSNNEITVVLANLVVRDGSGNLVQADNKKFIAGTGSDLQIFHDGSNSFIKEAGTGSLFIDGTTVYIRNAAGDEHLANFHSNGANNLYYDGVVKLSTNASGCTFGDNVKLQLGSSQDLQIYHDGSNSYVNNTGTGYLILQGNGSDDVSIRAVNGESGVVVKPNGGASTVELYYDNSKKFETKSNGVAVTGNIEQQTTGNVSLLIGSTNAGGASIYLDGDSNGDWSGSDYGYIKHNTSGNIEIGAANPAGGGNIELKVANTEYAINAVANGSVDLYYDNSKKLNTANGGVTVTGQLWASADVMVPDNAKLKAGDGEDLQIYHNGSTSFLTDGIGDLRIRGDAVKIQSASGENSARFIANGAAELYYDNSKKFETTSGGVNVTGALTVNGSAISGGGPGTGEMYVKLTNGASASDTGTNTFSGAYAGTTLASGAANNTFIGQYAGNETSTGDDNVAIGKSAFQQMQTGNKNIAIGSQAGQALKTTDANIAIGYWTFKQNLQGSTPTADGSIAIGFKALYRCTHGSRNIAIGQECTASSQTGSYNTGIGNGCQLSLSSGTYNSSYGDNAGGEITTGSNNLMLGHNAGRYNAPSGNVSTASNILCLGNNSISNFYCADTSISSSDKRDKTDVTDFTYGLSWVNKLKPITYRWDKRIWYNEYNEDGSLKTEVTPDGTKKRARQHIGFLAQDVLAVEQADGFASKKDDMLVVNLNEDDTAYGLKYERLVPVLVNAIKELSTEVNTLKTKVAALEA